MHSQFAWDLPSLVVPSQPVFVHVHHGCPPDRSAGPTDPCVVITCHRCLSNETHLWRAHGRWIPPHSTLLLLAGAYFAGDANMFEGV